MDLNRRDKSGSNSRSRKQKFHLQAESVEQCPTIVLTAVKREKQEEYFKGKVIFTVQNLILSQYPADLLTYLEIY